MVVLLLCKGQTAGLGLEGSYPAVCFVWFNISQARPRR